jgi:hypothetical protein
VKTLEQLKKEYIKVLCSGCTKELECKYDDKTRFNFISFSADRPCPFRRKIPVKKSN